MSGVLIIVRVRLQLLVGHRVGGFHQPIALDFTGFSHDGAPVMHCH